LKALRRDLCFKPLRGNVDTRIKKLLKGEYGAIVLAKAAIKRLNLNINMETLPIVPACGQGIIGIETMDTSNVKGIVCSINDEETFECISAEREFIRLMGAGCNDPIGAYVASKGDGATLSVMYAVKEDKEWKMFNFAEESSCMKELPERCAKKMNRLIKDG
jgi:hydroxymethylbilane synthase